MKIKRENILKACAKLGLELKNIKLAYLQQFLWLLFPFRMLMPYEIVRGCQSETEMFQ